MELCGPINFEVDLVGYLEFNSGLECIVSSSFTPSCPFHFLAFTCLAPVEPKCRNPLMMLRSEI